MTTAIIKENQFIISLDNDVLKLAMGGEDAKIQIINPHETGEYDSSALALLKTILSSLSKK